VLTTTNVSGNRNTGFFRLSREAKIDLIRTHRNILQMRIWPIRFGPEYGEMTMKKDLRKSQNLIMQLVCVCVISCFFLISNMNTAAAQQNEKAESGTETKMKAMQSQAWQPPPPPPDDFDWIQLKSGEWLKGELKVLYAKKLEFDSRVLPGGVHRAIFSVTMTALARPDLPLYGESRGSGPSSSDKTLDSVHWEGCQPCTDADEGRFRINRDRPGISKGGSPKGFSLGS